MDEVGSKRVLVTGASSGLGAAIARELALHGHRVAIVARRRDRLEDLAHEIAFLGGEAVVIADDLADPEAAERVVRRAVYEFDGLDHLINNAGVGLPRYYAESDPDALLGQIAVNLAAPILLTRFALPYLVESRGGVVNIGSAITTVANPILGVYGATKAGLAYWNDALRREIRGRGVAVSYVDLGPVDTEFFEAVRNRIDDDHRPLGVDPAPDSIYNAMRDRPPSLMTTEVEVAAERIVGLLARPMRRLAVTRRIVWPIRAMGAVLGLFPALADVAVATMIRRVEREEAAPRRAGVRS